MNHPERFRAVMSFQTVDRLPRWEWAMWWDRTIARWHEEGLPRNLPFHRVFDIARSFGLDPYQQFWFSTTEATIEAVQHHVEGRVADMDDYHCIRPRLYPRHESAIEAMRPWADRQARGEAAMRAEFERLAPLMRRGGFIPSVDHQTPPEVSLEQYRIYLRLLEEYTAAAAP